MNSSFAFKLNRGYSTSHPPANQLDMTMFNFLLSGKPGVGKTTLLIRIADKISDLSIGGFFTQEIREHGHRVGFRVETFSGQSGTLSHVAYKTGPRVGKYRVDVPAFEQIGVEELENALKEADVILVDEIGKMELFSKRFRNAVIRALDSEKPVVATVMARPNPFADALKMRSDVQLVEVTLENRTKLADELVTQIAAQR